MFEKFLNIIFHENALSGSLVFSCGKTGGQTDMSKLIAAFLDFTIMPKNDSRKNHGVLL